MQNAIDFPYQGWLIRVVPDDQGWTAQAQHPRMKQFCTVAGSFLMASDALQAALSYVTWAAPSSAVHQALQELRQADQLTQLESNALAISFDQGWRTHLPARDPES
uniref:hypothetical protein n=1 Tax=Trichocoleus desertorum TaxID=1481672 RepID=UPI0025B4AAE7|nr:hypothetical protein [Trichocoleus desertorum]